MDASRYLVACVFAGLLAGCVESADSELNADDMSLAFDTADGPSFPVAPAGATCALIQRGTLGQAQDTDIGIGNGANWAAGAYPFTWTGISPYDHWSAYQFDLSPIPANTSVVLATFTTYVSWNEQSSTVRAHRITNPWNEATATASNFGGTASWDPTVLGTFNPGGVGWRSVDVTGLAQAWHSGAAANNGLLLEEDPIKLHNFFASEVSTVNRRPSLYVCWVDAPPACGNSGAVCEINSNCCDGLSCISGACGVVPVCESAGSACGDDGECCAGLVCNGGTCGTPPPVCSAAGGVCNASTPCCNGAICNDGVCPGGGGDGGAGGGGPTCSEPGSDCNADHPCCNGAICNDGVCPSAVTCDDVGSMCDADSDCCSGSCFDGMCIANDVCMPVDELGCNPSNPCCDGGHCAFNFCFLDEDLQCDLPGAPCSIGCCWGFVCSANDGSGVCVAP